MVSQIYRPESWLTRLIDITFLANTTDLSTAGDFLRVPLLIGSTAQEGDIFVVAAEQLSIGSTLPIATQELSGAITSVSTTFSVLARVY